VHDHLYRGPAGCVTVATTFADFGFFGHVWVSVNVLIGVIRRTLLVRSRGAQASDRLLSRAAQGLKGARRRVGRRATVL